MKKLFLLFLPIGLALIAVIFFATHAPRHPTGIESSTMESTNYWQQFEFTLYDKDNVDGVLAGIKITGEPLLTGEEKIQLIGVLADFLLLNQTHEFASFERFRFGENPAPQGVFNPQVVEFYRKKLDENMPTKNLTDREVVEKFWNVNMLAFLKSNGLFWREIGRHESTIEITEAPPAPPGVLEIGSRRPNWGVFTANPVFIDSPTPRELQNKHGTLKYATCCFAIRNESKVGAGVYLQLYWYPEEKRWVPAQLGDSGSNDFDSNGL